MNKHAIKNKQKSKQTNNKTNKHAIKQTETNKQQKQTSNINN